MHQKRKRPPLQKPKVHLVIHPMMMWSRMPLLKLLRRWLWVFIMIRILKRWNSKRSIMIVQVLREILCNQERRWFISTIRGWAFHHRICRRTWRKRCNQNRLAIRFRQLHMDWRYWRRQETLEAYMLKKKIFLI